MRLRAFLDGDQTREVEVRRRGDLYEVAVDEVRHTVDVRKLEGDVYSILFEGRSFEVSVEDDGDAYTVRHGGAARTLRLVDPLGATASAAMVATGRAVVVSAVMPGKVVRLLVEEGEDVEEGQGLLVLEAMKMENEVTAPRAGRIGALRVEPGQQVETGEELAVVE